MDLADTLANFVVGTKPLAKIKPLKFSSGAIPVVELTPEGKRPNDYLDFDAKPAMASLLERSATCQWYRPRQKKEESTSFNLRGRLFIGGH
jgi:HD superfamily phosphodiesterase